MFSLSIVLPGQERQDSVGNLSVRQIELFKYLWQPTKIWLLEKRMKHKYFLEQDEFHLLLNLLEHL